MVMAEAMAPGLHEAEELAGLSVDGEPDRAKAKVSGARQRDEWRAWLFPDD